MATVFVLGPSHWQDRRSTTTPREMRERIVEVLEQHGHRAFLMEQATGRESECLAEKFLRLLGNQTVTHVVVYWPDEAKMPTTLAELVALRFLATMRRVPDIWILHQDNVIDASAGAVVVRPADGKIAYLRDLMDIGVNIAPWHDSDELLAIVTELGRTGFAPW